MYTENDILLGIFTSSDLAEQAKEKYITKVAHQDLHKDQAYMQVNLQDDVIIHILENYEIHHIAYILQKETEGFGQVGREILHISSSLQEILNIAKNTHIDPNGFPNSFLVYNRLIVNKLYYENEDHYV